MREFLLVVPDLMPPAGAFRALPAPPVQALRTGQRFAPARSLPDGWRAVLAARLGRADLDGLPVAAVVAAALPPPPDACAAPGGAWLATPLHLVAGLDTLHLPQDGILALEPGELAELADGFARELGGGRLVLRPATADAFVLLGLDVPAATTVEPQACLGADLARAQAAGAGAGPLRRLMSEIEMWLHDQPLNRRRAAAGQPPVRALWLWGGGAARSSVRPVTPAGTATGVPPGGAASLPRRVFSDDAWVRAACRLAAVELAPSGGLPDAADFAAPGDVVATARLHASDLPDVDAFERRHLQPAFEALAAGRLGRLTVLAADRQLTLAASDRFRLWRPRRAWLAALGALE